METYAILFCMVASRCTVVVEGNILMVFASNFISPFLSFISRQGGHKESCLKFSYTIHKAFLHKIPSKMLIKPIRIEIK